MQILRVCVVVRNYGLRNNIVFNFFIEDFTKKHKLKEKLYSFKEKLKNDIVIVWIDRFLFIYLQFCMTTQLATNSSQFKACNSSFFESLILLFEMLVG